MSLEETGITVPELIEIVPTFLEEVLAQYEDDQKLTAEEIIVAIAHLCDKLQKAAVGATARAFGVAELALKLVAKIV